MVVSFVTKIAVTEYRAIGQETIVEYRIRLWQRATRRIVVCVLHVASHTIHTFIHTPHTCTHTHKHTTTHRHTYTHIHTYRHKHTLHTYTHSDDIHLLDQLKFLGDEVDGVSSFGDLSRDVALHRQRICIGSLLGRDLGQAVDARYCCKPTIHLYTLHP